jgi:hypothetical protein
MNESAKTVIFVIACTVLALLAYFAFVASH